MSSCVPFIGVLQVIGAALAMLLAAALAVLVYLTQRRAQHARENDQSFSKIHDWTAAFIAGRNPKQSLQELLDETLAAVAMPRGVALVQSPAGDGSNYTVSGGFAGSVEPGLMAGSLRNYLLRSLDRWGGIVVFSDLASNDRMFASWQLEPIFMQFRDFFLEHGAKSLIVIALSNRQQQTGTMVLASNQPRSLSPHDLRQLEFIRAQVGLALAARMLERAAERHTDDLGNLHRIAESLAAAFDIGKQVEILRNELQALFGVANVWLAFQDRREESVEIFSGNAAPGAQGKEPEPDVRGLVDYVFRARAPLMIARDFEKSARRLSIPSPDPRIRFWCGVPMQVSEESASVLAIADCTRENVLDTAQFQLLKVLASEAGVAIENARLYQREQKRARYLTMLGDLARRASAVLDPRELRASVASEIRKTFDYDAVRFEALDAAQQETLVEAQEGYAEDVLRRRFKLDAGLSGLAATSGESVVANDVSRDPRYVPLDPRVRASLNIPLLYAGTCHGVLVVESFHENAFPAESVLMMSTLAGHLAIALHNAHAYKSATQEAITDGLTHLKTHRFFMEAFEAEWRRAPRSGRPFSVLLLDLDSFKPVNDRYGHSEGDRVLVAVARLLESRSRSVNPVSRYGGDEFAVLMPEASLEQGEILADRLRSSLAADPYLASHGVTGSFGLANFPTHGATPDELLRVANFGMMLAKHDRGNCVRIASRVDGGSVDQKVLDAYLGVTVKRLFSTGPEAFEEYMQRLERAVESAAGPGRSQASLMDTVTALAFAIDAKDHYTQGHSQAVSRLASQIARQIGLPESQVEEIRLAGILHDIGKIGIPEQLLNKPCRLTDDEFEVVKTHAVLGEKILGPLKGKGMARIRQMVRSHHECYDGRGYPDGLRGEDIPLGARILTVADCFDTIVSKRTYKEGRSTDDALFILRHEAGVHFDRALVEAFVQSFTAAAALESSAERFPN